MGVQYEIDLRKYSIQKFKKSLKSRDLIPSRAMLKEDIDSSFEILERCGITNLKELTNALNSKQKIEQFSRESGLTIEYLTLLNREAKSYLSKPVRLDKFPGVRKEHLDKLENLGIRNSKQLFLQAQEKGEREGLSEDSGISVDVLNELIGLSDLSRIYGVGPVFARMIYDVGIMSVQDFVNCTAEDFIRIYEDQTQKKADFGVSEIQFSLELARELNIAVKTR